MRDYEKELLQDCQKRLLEVTQGCADNMHEPPVILVGVWGEKLDNAGLGHEAFMVLVNENTGRSETFNLANLIALARMANIGRSQE